MSLSCSGITKIYGYQPVLNNISFVLNPRERIGLVGANGAGKSTLLRIIAGEIEPDDGTITRPPGMQIGCLAQAAAGADDLTLAERIAESMRHLRALERRMRELEARMANPDSLEAVLAEYGEVSDQFERYGGYDMGHRVDAVLDGLGIAHLPRQQRFGTLSGGEQARVMLALLLLQAPDILLLDEPTNHLDFASLRWLEDYLQSYRGAILVVSHDRHFLNRAVSAIIEIDEHSRAARRYSGDYDAYRRAKAAERRQWEADFAAQQEEIKALRLEMKVTARQNANYRAHTDNDKFIPNFKRAAHEATVARRVQLAAEKLSRIEADPIPRPPAPLRFVPDFDPQQLAGRYALTASRISHAFGDRVILRDISFTLGPNSRVVIVAPNGAGKSTLLKILAGELVPDQGTVMLNPAVRIGCLHQQESASVGFDYAKPALDTFADGLPGSPQQLKATLLQSGLFRYAELDRPAAALSEGQRRKLQIARLIASRANLLILDEPTNYISLDVLEAFETALRDFPGPIIAASHDRRFIEQFGGEVWELRDGLLSYS
jgi:macrolide transport system ATP-binding/permease protein